MSQTDTKTTFTPGPWRVIGGDSVYTDDSPTGAYDRSLADLSNSRVGSAEMEANARLMAAAPTMLDALERFIASAVTPPTPAGYGTRGAAAFAPWEQNLIDAQNEARRIIDAIRKGG